ncbi:hypothetical protein K377_08242 [Streptomyces sp. PsTaAH-137]|nr:hypothetical protein K377_08242 [Streptomyces sp. PsTaAH-137]
MDNLIYILIVAIVLLVGMFLVGKWWGNGK